MNMSGPFGVKFGDYYVGFKISDNSTLESMRVLFEEIRRRIWSDEERASVVHRTRFNRSFKHINLWKTEICPSREHELGVAFKTFSKARLEGQTVRVKFTKLECKQAYKRIYVSLKLHFKSQAMLREIQQDAIKHFKDFEAQRYDSPYDLHCSLLYIYTGKAFREVERAVSQCEFEPFETELDLFVVSHRREILYQYPESTQDPIDSEEWVTRSLCLMDFPDCRDEECWEIIRSIARSSSFEDFGDYMVENCRWETEYYRKPRIVVQFKGSSLRDDFHRYFMRYLAEMDCELVVADVIQGSSDKGKVGVYKALPRPIDDLHFYAEEVCFRELPDFRSRVDAATLELYLQQLREPYYQYFFETRSELDALIDSLKRGSGTEYLSSVC